MGWFPAIDVSASGLYAQRVRLNTIAENIANVKTTRTHRGGPYTRKDVVFTASGDLELREGFRGSELRRTHPAHITGSKAQEAGYKMQGGVGVAVVKDYDTPFNRIYDPSHPDADKDGYVKLPNIDVVRELVDMMVARRSYEANIAVIEASKSMAFKALEIGR